MPHDGSTGYLSRYHGSRRWHLDPQCPALRAAPGQENRALAATLDRLAAWQLDDFGRAPCTGCAIPALLDGTTAGPAGRTALACAHAKAPKRCRPCAALAAFAGRHGLPLTARTGRVAVLLPAHVPDRSAIRTLFRVHDTVNGPGAGPEPGAATWVGADVTAGQWELAWHLVETRKLRLDQALAAGAALARPASLTTR